ncbi:MAG: pyridoxamine 5'-phosphate oxidase family protein [Deltaproteobacteria bacterium]|nr:pyridoxamine 5'-phosphate oxidase family protein [Deltaproteobacteria bacterium]
MEAIEILEYINNNKVFSLATSNETVPSVRMMITFKADSTGIYFATDTRKQLHAEILRNPNVELCFFNKELNNQIRIRGVATVEDNEAVKMEAIEKLPFLSRYLVGSKLSPNLTVFRIRHSIAKPWNFEGVTSLYIVDL